MSDRDDSHSASSVLPAIKAITCYSPSHQALFEKMAASFPNEPGLELFARTVEQEGDGTFSNEHWRQATGRKMQFTLEALEALPDDGLLLWVDADIMFFQPVREDLIRLMEEMRADILFQNDRCALCAGFFIVRKKPRTVELFREVLRVLPEYSDDQAALNGIIAASGVRYGLLPRRYYTIGLDGPQWRVGSPLKLPKNISMLHANWMIGVDTKLEFFALAEEKMGREKARLQAEEPWRDASPSQDSAPAELS